MVCLSEIQKIFYLPQTRRLFLERLHKLKFPTINLPKTHVAVLVPLCNIEGTVSLLYTVKPTLGAYKGQASFPGGCLQCGDIPVETAIQEAYDEIGIPNDKITVWGEGPAVADQRNQQCVIPVIGVIHSLMKEEIRLSESVAGVFALPVQSLCEPNNQFHTQYTDGRLWPAFRVKNCRLWGVTAYITHLVLSCLLPENLYKNQWKRKRVSQITADT